MQNRVWRPGFGCGMSNGGVGWWRVVVGWCEWGGGGGGAARLSAREGGGARATKILKLSHYGSVLGGSTVGWGWGVLWCHRAPWCYNLLGGELGVSWYCGRGLLCSPWDLHPFLHPHLLPTLSLPSPSAPLILPGTHEWAGYGPTGLTSNANRVRVTRRQSRCPIAFGGVWNSDQFPCGFDFDAAFFIGLLKSCKYLYILLTYINVFLYFYFVTLQSVGHAILPFHFRVGDISFYITNPRRFWNSVNEDYKTHLHGK
jgi:hypothetical protein